MKSFLEELTAPAVAIAPPPAATVTVSRADLLHHLDALRVMIERLPEQPALSKGDWEDRKVAEIITAVAAAWDISERAIIGRRRFRPFVEARFTCWHLIRLVTQMPLDDVRPYFSVEDHSSITHGIRVLADWRPFNAVLDARVRELERRFNVSRSAIRKPQSTFVS